MATSLRPIIGLDIGRSTVKGVFRSRNGNNINLMFPSVVSRAIELTSDSEKSLARKDTVSIGANEYFIGETAVAQSRTDIDSGLRDDWIFSDQHRSLFLGAIQHLKHQGAERTDESIIVVGLPGRLYGAQKKALKEDLEKIHPNGKIIVLPQPLGPHQLLQFTASGTESDELSKVGTSWGVIEVGQYTTDFCAVLEGRIIESSFGSCGGMSIAAAQLTKLLQAKGMNISIDEASRAFITKTVKFFGETIDVNAEIEESIRPLVDEIKDKANAVIGVHARVMDGILLAGGGAPLIYPALKAMWRHARLCEDSRYAVSEGFARFGTAWQLHTQARG